MTAIKFTTKNGAPVVESLEFTRAPSFPRARTRPAPARIIFTTADGTVHLEEKGFVSTVALDWPESGPMPAADFHAQIGNNLRDFYAAVRGPQDMFTFEDEHGDKFDACFSEPPQFSEVAHGFAGQITLKVMLWSGA